MQDQYEQRLCERYGLGHLSTFINGTISFSERQTRLRQLELGYYKLVYVTPEQLERGYVLDALKRADEQVGIRYLAFDEAHCISQWGHDFRSSYLNIVRRIRHRQIKPVRIALTATASPEVIADICEELDLIDKPVKSGGHVYIDASNRPELNLIVRVCRDTEEKVSRILDDLRELNCMNGNNSLPSSAIVFMPHTGGDVDSTSHYAVDNMNGNQHGKLSAGATKFAAYLERELQDKVAIYHSKMEMESNSSNTDNAQQASDVENISVAFGNLSGRVRWEEQSKFLNDDYQIMVATKGFGMGIDKPNIRRVIHRSLPANLEAYAQEAGRAGRNGEIADAILYYSPNVPGNDTENARTKSDYAIQDFFLTEKYVRKIDIEVMYEFLKTVTRRVSGRLYFTNDEAVTFFDRYRGEKLFEWPKFSERQERGYESCEHAEILDRGYQYQQKTNYIDRVLSVLYRIRPTITERKHISFIESCQETGAQVVRLAPKDADAILKSNTYFGELFKEKGLDPTTLTEWLTSCREKDVFDFAEFLDLSIAETCALLRDVRSIDGSFKGKKWVSNLLDFQTITTPKYGPAEGKNSLTEWRDYAGARRRASKPKAYGRARQRGCEDNPDENDWFDWGELCYSKGWEVKLGDVFSNNIIFNQYLNAFMNYHFVREQNDRNAFRLLLTDYIGVNSDGSLSEERKRNCLRNVMLGYFKTGEVVLGGNCRSCSNCVPDGNFEQNIDKRRQLVQRLPEEFFEITQEAEQKTNALPSLEFTANFWQIVTTQEDRQRGLLEYIKGWTAKLLQDTPEHKTAMWFRLTGMAQQLIDSSEAEVIQYMGSLIPHTSLAELQQIEPVLNEFLTQFDKSTNVHILCANLLQKLQRHEECASTWVQIVEMTKGDDTSTRQVLFTAYSALQRIYGVDGPLPDLRRYRDYRRMAARKAQDWGEAAKLLQPLVTRWNWAELTDEIAAYKRIDWVNSLAPRLVKWWIEQHNSEIELAQVIAYIADNKFYKSWDAETTAYIIAKIPQSQHGSYPALTVWWLTQIAGSGNKNLVDTTIFINDVVAMMQRGHEFSTATNERFIISIFREFSENQRYQLQEQLLGIPGLHDSIRRISIPFLSDLTEPEAMKWLDWFGHDPVRVDETHNLWKTRAIRSSGLAAHYFKVLLQMLPESDRQTKDFARIIVNSGDSWVILSQIATMPAVEPFIRRSRGLSLLVTHASLLAQLTQMPEVANSRKITSQELDTILRMCRSSNLPSGQSDQMFAAILHCIWRRYSNWDTLPDRLLQAYNRAGLREEAIEVAESRPNLLVGTARVPALQYARQITLKDNLNLDLKLKKITESCINRWAMSNLQRY